MKKIHIDCLNDVIEFDNAIKRIKVRSSKDFKHISFNLLNEITISIDNDIVDNKNVLIIYNPFEINLNDKKFLNNIYKELESNINDEEKRKLHNIELAAYDFFDDLKYISTISFEYNPEIEITKLFSAFNLSIPQDNNYLELITSYFILNERYCKTKFIISFGLTSLLDSNDINLLEKELAYNDLVLLDIIYVGNEDYTKIDLTIEEEWCII